MCTCRWRIVQLQGQVFGLANFNDSFLSRYDFQLGKNSLQFTLGYSAECMVMVPAEPVERNQQNPNH